ARDMELRGLKKADVNTFKKEITFRDTKNGTNRTVKLIGDSVKLLNKLQADPRYHDSDNVFASAKNPNRPYDIRVPFKKALEKAGITDFNFHDLRHCVTSFLVELKVPESAIMRIQGWSERDRIDIYRHNPEHDAKEQKKLVRNLPRRAG
ncbi:MAG: site-specific integrase, partial [SAR324 cluster bacterium]|nr:site-specific integrase [SAR324 cluster bacterium]